MGRVERAGPVLASRAARLEHIREGRRAKAAAGSSTNGRCVYRLTDLVALTRIILARLEPRGADDEWVDHAVPDPRCLVEVLGRVAESRRSRHRESEARRTVVTGSPSGLSAFRRGGTACAAAGRSRKRMRERIEVVETSSGLGRRPASYAASRSLVPPRNRARWETSSGQSSGEITRATWSPSSSDVRRRHVHAYAEIPRPARRETSAATLLPRRAAFETGALCGRAALG